MTYRVLIQPLALGDLHEYHQWASKHAPITADRWLSRFHAELQSLGANPERFGLALENRKTRRELRQFLFGKRPNVYRTVFTIDGDTVRVIRIRRGTRRPFTRRELED